MTVKTAKATKPHLCRKFLFINGFFSRIYDNNPSALHLNKTYVYYPSTGTLFSKKLNATVEKVEDWNYFIRNAKELGLVSVPPHIRESIDRKIKAEDKRLSDRKQQRASTDSNVVNLSVHQSSPRRGNRSR